MAGFCTHQLQTRTIKSEDNDADPTAAPDMPACALACSYCSRDAAEEAATNCYQASTVERLSNPPPGGDADLKRVFVWSLEDILILEAALSGKFVQLSSKECDQVHIDDVAGNDSEQEFSGYKFFTTGFHSETGLPIAGGAWGLGLAARRPATQTGPGGRSGLDWMRTLALRYRHIQEIYDAYNGDAPNLLGSTKAEFWTRLSGEVDQLTRGWRNRLRHILEVISARSTCRNVLISSSPLLLTFTRLLLYGLGTVFPARNVYAANKVGKPFSEKEPVDCCWLMLITASRGYQLTVL
ncbi:Eyes absent 1 [Sparganum proliferum]